MNIKEISILKVDLHLKVTINLIKGILSEPFGQYKGEFKNGVKDGLGTYNFKTKLKYVGYYENGIKKGHGTIYN